MWGLIYKQWLDVPSKPKVKIIQAPSRLTSEGWKSPWYREHIGKEFEIDLRFKDDKKLFYQWESPLDALFFAKGYITWINGEPREINKSDCSLIN